MEELCKQENIKELHRSAAGILVSTSTSFAKKSTAVKVPTMTRRREQEYNNVVDEDEELEDGERKEMIPPHVLVSRRRAAGNMAFSLCSGQGRTLKGRDLRLVRDSVLRMTGYLEG